MDWSYVKRTFCILLMASACVLVSVQAQTKLLRFPDLHGDSVVFCYAGDLWIASDKGGSAKRLTAHPGQELFPKFSPDGQWIAFTGQYDGDEQVYIMPSAGGEPKQLTFYPARGPLPARWGYDNQVYGWTPDGSAVLFRSLRDSFTLGSSRLFTVEAAGGLPQPLPMPQAGAGDLSPDGDKVVYSPLFRDFRSWKRYQGGWAQDLVIFDLKSFEVEQVTRDKRTDRDPMWMGNRIFYSSDRDGTLNIYSFDVKSKKTEQITKSRKWDVRWPSSGADGRIVYEMAGELHILNSSNGRSRKISISVPTDGLARRSSRISVEGNITGGGLSPKGERAVFTARGDIFSAPIEKGPTRNLTRTPGIHEKNPDWSPDGSRIAFISDRDGEEELYVMPQDGKGEPEQLTDGNVGMLFNPQWSPDGKRIVYGHKDGGIFVLDVESKQSRQIAHNPAGLFFDYEWSPKGGYLAFSLGDSNGFNSVYVWSAQESKLNRITGELFNEFNPSWDPDGKYLYYLSDRQFAPQIGSFEFNYALDRETGIFALGLRSDVPHPFPPESDEVTIEKKADEDAQSDSDKESQGDSDKAEKKAESDYIAIEFEGLAKRVVRVPVSDDNYFGLTAAKGHLLYGRGGPFVYGRQSAVQPSLRIFSIKDRRETVLAERIAGYGTSLDRKKVAVRQGNRFNLYNVSPAAKGKGKRIPTSGLRAERVPKAEWEQIFDEVWRRFRDFFYVENMHGYDWQALREQYRPLLQHVSHRADLTYVISEMISELNVGHAYIAGGDYEVPDRPPSGLPGARFELDSASGRYRISGIFEGHNEEPIYRSPLTEIGIDAKVGDYVLAIDGVELSSSVNPYRLLQHKTGQVTWTVNSTPEMDGARDITYTPLNHERNLIYLGWVEGNRRKVEEATGGRVGYLHIPDMGANGIREFIKWYYGQIRKEGLVVDVRGNGGGNVSQMLIERLKRDLLRVGFPRTSDHTGTYPSAVFHGHMVCLLSETSASDGDIFPAMFKAAGLGPLIGKRSWGGVIGITNRGPLIDGGSVNVPEFGFASTEGEWVIEGYGVDPDIVVENDPKSVIQGKDPQLERGIEEVMKRIRSDPKKLPTRQPGPIKTD